MRLSKHIAQLQVILAAEGDLYVVYQDDYDGNPLSITGVKIALASDLSWGENPVVLDGDRRIEISEDEKLVVLN